MKSIIGKFNDGGPLITYTILILLFVIIFLFVKALMQEEFRPKAKSLVASLAWFSLAWAYLGRTFGLIMAFDNIAAAGEITPSLMAGGLKMALVGPMVGLVTFIIARAFILILILKEKKETE